MKQASELSYPEARDVVRLPTKGRLFFHLSLAEGFSWGINAVGHPTGIERCPQVRTPGSPCGRDNGRRDTQRVCVPAVCGVGAQPREAT